MEEERYYRTYCFYDARTRRVAIFAKAVGEGDLQYLQIYVVTCSAKDRFSKKKANLIYNGRDKGDSVKGYFTTDVVDGNPKKSFIRWCEANYYKLVDATFEVEAKVYVKDERGEEPDFLEEICFVKDFKPKSIEKEA